MITIIYPSRGRPDQAIKTITHWVDNIGIPDTEFEFVLSLDTDDIEQWNYPRSFSILNFTVFRFANRSAIDAINNPAKWYATHRKLPGDFLILISDDFECPKDWGKHLLQLSGMADWILKTEDGIQPWLVTLPIMDWKYFGRFGYVYNPEYRHGWSDTEMTCVGELTGRLFKSNLFFKHNHYTVGGIKDAISERADQWFEQGRLVFQERINKNFDLYPDQIKGKMTDNIYSRMKR